MSRLEKWRYAPFSNEFLFESWRHKTSFKTYIGKQPSYKNSKESQRRMKRKMKSLRGGRLRLVVEGRKTVIREGMQRRTIEFTSSLQIGFWWQSPLWRTQLMSSDLPETESPESSYSYREERENQLYFKHISLEFKTRGH